MNKKIRDIQSVAVTGATGLIGRRLIPAFANVSVQTRALVRVPSNRTGAQEQVIGNLANDEAIEQLVKGTEAVVHLAGVAHTRLRSKAEEEQAKQVNVEGSRRLVTAAADAGVRHFMLISSAHVYRGQIGFNLSEDSPTEGDTPYGQMKLEAERFVRAAETPVMRVTILRPCLTYGPGVRFNLQSLMRAIRKGLYVHVHGAEVVRSMASVDTVVAAIMHLLEAPAKEHNTFNVADRTPVDLDEWTNHLADLMGVRNPRTVPLSAMKIAANVGSFLRTLGLPAPITRQSLQKLTESFSIGVDRLAATGFAWPETKETVLREMISAEFAGRRS